jgi:DNA-binding XRE family transcriptional regulator
MKNNIKKLLKERKCKTSEIIRECNISRSYFYKLVNENSIPSLNIAFKISEVLRTPLEDVFLYKEKEE